MKDWEYGGFQSRRRRNIDFGVSKAKEKVALSVQWPKQPVPPTGDPDKDQPEALFEQGAPELLCEVEEEDNGDQTAATTPEEAQTNGASFRLDGQTIDFSKLSQQRAEQPTQKLTIYLNVSLFDLLKRLKDEGYIESYSRLITQSLKAYLQTKH